MPSSGERGGRGLLWSPLPQTCLPQPLSYYRFSLSFPIFFLFFLIIIFSYLILIKRDCFCSPRLGSRDARLPERSAAPGAGMLREPPRSWKIPRAGMVGMCVFVVSSIAGTVRSRKVFSWPQAPFFSRARHSWVCR